MESKMAIEKKRNYTIDTIRLFAIFFIVFIHTTPGYNSMNSDLQQNIIQIIFAIARLGVPIFFAISGYYLYKKDKLQIQNDAKKNITKLSKYLCFGILSYIIIVSIITGQNVFMERIETTSATDLWKMFAFNIPLWGGVLWFIVALICCYLFYHLNFVIFNKTKYIAITTIVGYSVGLMIQPYSVNVGFDYTSVWFSGARSFLFGALLFFSVGFYIAKYRERFFDQISNKKLVIFIICTFILYVFETSVLAKQYNGSICEIFVMLPLVLAGIMLLITREQFSMLGKDTIIPKLGMQLTLYIYIIHMFVISYMHVRACKYEVIYDNFICATDGEFYHNGITRVIVSWVVVFLGTFVIAIIYRYVVLPLCKNIKKYVILKLCKSEKN